MKPCKLCYGSGYVREYHPGYYPESWGTLTVRDPRLRTMPGLRDLGGAGRVPGSTPLLPRPSQREEVNGEEILRRLLDRADPDHPDVRPLEDFLREFGEMRATLSRRRRGDPPGEMVGGKEEADPPRVYPFIGEGAEDCARRLYADLSTNWTGVYLARTTR